MRKLVAAISLQRHLPLLIAVVGFSVLLLAASRLAGDFSFAGLSDHTIRPIAHFSVYGLLAVALAYGLRQWYLLAWTLSVILATAEEFHQLFVPGRMGDIGDLQLNVVGITFFLVAAKILTPHRRRIAVNLARLVGYRTRRVVRFILPVAFFARG